MFIGHLAVGFASKRWAPRTSLVLLLAAPLFADLLWPVFLLFGIEHVRIDPHATRYSPLDLYDYPWSHGLLALMAWASAVALVYWACTRYRAGAVVLWIGVVSHWVLDWVTHRPDMPLWPGSPRYGLGLWNSVAGTMTVELVMLAVGVWIYGRATRSFDHVGRYAFVAYVVLLVALDIGDRFGGPPPSVHSLIWTSIVAEPVLLAWAWWFDRHRVARRAHELRPLVAAR